MKGTERQVAWAEDIRELKIECAQNSGTVLFGAMFFDWCQLKGIDWKQELIRFANSLDDAKYWINSRNDERFYFDFKEHIGYTEDEQYRFSVSEEYSEIRRARRQARRKSV